MFWILETILLFVIFGNSVHDCSEVIGNYTNVKAINDKSCGISLFSSELKGCFKYHNDLPLNMKGSRNAIPGEAPWSVLLVFEQSQISGNKSKRSCGGVLIDKQLVMTSAHCFRDQNGMNIKPIKVHLNPVLAQDYLELSTDYFSPVLIGMRDHPKYVNERDKVNSVYDIGLVKLTKPVQFKPGVVNTICLPPERNFTYFEEEYAFTTGWNSLYNEENRTLNRLQIQTIKVSSHSNFVPKENYPNWYSIGYPNKNIAGKGHFIWEGYIYGKTLGKQKICSSDFGSPVWQYYLGRAVLIGIVSNAKISSSDDECQYENFTRIYSSGRKEQNKNETFAYITWVPMMMEWIIKFMKNPY